MSSTPNIEQFQPVIPFQKKVIELIRNDWDYSKGVIEIMLSGSVGSAKSLLMAHIGLTHAMFYKQSVVLLCRRALDDLKGTLILKIQEHMDGVLEEGEDYEYNRSQGNFTFWNGSRFESFSWADKNFLRFRSVEASAALVEELTENKGEYWGFYKEMRARIGRLPHVPEHFILSATNPDSPSHPAYKYFIDTRLENRKVFYSITRDNPFLPRWYIDQLYEIYDEKEALRMLEGQWLEIKSEVIYYSFSDQNIIERYDIKQELPIIITFDFNIGIGKPLSYCAMQYNPELDSFFIFNEWIIEGANTEEAIGQSIEDGLFRKNEYFIIRGDCNGRARTTKSNKTDYEIIKNCLRNLNINFDIDIPNVNPQVRKRHIMLNGYLKNSVGRSRIFITRNCKGCIEGLRLSTLKKGSTYIEDDSYRFQHVTTAIGYAIMRQLDHNNSMKSARQVSF